MRASSICAVIAALGLAACASGVDPKLRSAPPTGYVAPSEESPFGVAYETYGDGSTKISVRLNQTATPERARDLALYQAARMAQHRNAGSFAIVQEDAGMDCHHTERDASATVGAGDAIAVLPAMVFAAILSSSAKDVRYTALPTHELWVSFAPDGAAAPGAERVAVDRTLSELTPVFEPNRVAAEAADASSGIGAKKKSRRPSRRERDARLRNAERNADVCKARFKKQRKLEKQRRRRHGATDSPAIGAGNDSGGAD